MEDRARQMQDEVIDEQCEMKGAPCAINENVNLENDSFQEPSETSVVSDKEMTHPEEQETEQHAGCREPRHFFGIATDAPSIFVRMRYEAFNNLRLSVGKYPAERGGIFIGKDPFLIEHFLFDEISDPEGTVYYPHVKYLNEILERDFEPHGLFFTGVGHSHPRGLWRPSGNKQWGDVKAARNNLLAKSNAHLQALFIPIIESEAETGQFHIHPFVMLRKDLLARPAILEVID